MDNITNIALIAQMIESAEKNIQSAKQLLREMMGGGSISTNEIAKKAQVLNVARCDSCTNPLLTQFTSTAPTRLTIDVPTVSFSQILNLPAFTSIQAPYTATVSNLP